MYYICRVKLTRVLTIKFQKMDKQEINKEIEMLEVLIEFHSKRKVIENSSEREMHIDAMLDRLSALIKERDKQE